MKQYIDLVNHVIENGVRKENRTGVDTVSTFGYYYEHDLQDGFPLLTTKKISWKNIVIELLWFLSGSSQSEFLDRHKCGFWKPWYNNDEAGTVKNCYGPAWRSFPQHISDEDNAKLGDYDFFPSMMHNDQIKWLVNELQTNPMSRRMVVSAWAPGEAQKAPLPPCHCMFICNVQNVPYIKITNVNELATKNAKLDCGDFKKLCLHLSQRSCDVGLGVPYNLASYALLNHLLARFANLEPGIFGHSLVDAHIYTSMYQQFEKPELAEYDHIPALQQQVKREPRKLPKLIIDDSIKTLEDVEALLDKSVTTEDIMKLFVLEGYDPHPAINMKVAV